MIAGAHVLVTFADRPDRSAVEDRAPIAFEVPAGATGVDLVDAVADLLSRRVKPRERVEVGRQVPGTAGVGTLRWGAKGDQVMPFTWRRYETATR